MDKMSAIGVQPSQLAVMLNHLEDETDGHFQNKIVANMISISVTT
jgi:hypothetical protein